MSSACFCFTKLLRPLVRRWRSPSHLSFVYLSDGLGSQPDKISANVCSYFPQLKQKKVSLFPDNQAAAEIVSIGSSCAELQDIALQIFNDCLKNHIELQAERVPCECNQRAVDLLSRFTDKDDWSSHPVIFRLVHVDDKWGPHTIDRFGSYYNFQLPCYNSRFLCPGSSGADAFAQDWDNENNWLGPPLI